jgi:ribosomal protein L37AE/L43A
MPGICKEISMRSDARGASTERSRKSDADPNLVTECPFCQSGNVSTTSKAVTAATYWRCHACGQIWNGTRLDVARPYGRRRW